MSPRLAGFKARDMIRVHAGKDLKPQTLAGIVADIGVSAEEFLRLV